MVIDDCGEGDYIIVQTQPKTILSVCGDGILGLMCVSKRGTHYHFTDHDPTPVEMVLPAPPAPGIRDVRCSSSRDGP